MVRARARPRRYAQHYKFLRISGYALACFRYAADTKPDEPEVPRRAHAHAHRRLSGNEAKWE